MTICGTLGVYLQFSKTYTVPILGSKVVDRYPNFCSNNIDKYVNGDTGTTLMKTESDGELFFSIFFSILVRFLIK